MHRLPEELASGYRSFKAGRYAGERERYRRLAEKGQSPKSLVIACCDSRAAPEVVFDASPGQLFVLRNIANLVPPFEAHGGRYGTPAAIEFAVQALKVSNILVLGHGRCGGVAAALDEDFEPLAESDFVGHWVEDIRPLAGEIRADETVAHDDRHTALERRSVSKSLEHLRTYPYVRDAEAAGRLSLHGAWFDIAAGALWVMDPDSGSFVPAEED